MFETFIVTKGGTNFRSAPKVQDGTVIEYLPKGSVVQVFEVAAGTTFYRAISPSGKEGYVTALDKYVESFEPEWLTKAKQVIAWGVTQLGVDYVFGSSRSNDSTYDCSDFTKRCCKEIGLILGGNSREQAKQGVHVPIEELRTGDLILYARADGYVHHVGFYVYPNLTLHTFNDHNVVLDENLKDTGLRNGVTWSDFKPKSYWRNAAAFGRRVIE